MYILNSASAIKEMTIKELKDFIFKNDFSRIGFSEYSLKKRQKKKDIQL